MYWVLFDFPAQQEGAAPIDPTPVPLTGVCPTLLIPTLLIVFPIPEVLGVEWLAFIPDDFWALPHCNKFFKALAVLGGDPAHAGAT